MGSARPWRAMTAATLVVAACGGSQTTTHATTAHGSSGATERAPLAAPLAQGPSQLGVGESHVCFLRDGTPYCAGAGDDGQLGDGVLESRSVARPVSGLAGVVELACGERHCCALARDGGVWCWGGNEAGQVGEPIDVIVAAPRRVGELAPATRVFAGGQSSCARLEDGRLACWGTNLHGRLAQPWDAERAGRTEPIVIAGLERVAELSVGIEHSVARLEDGRVVAWGYNGTRQVGTGDTVGGVPPQTVDVRAPATGVLASRGFTWVLGASGSVTQIGFGPIESHGALTMDVDAARGAVALVAGPHVGCARLAGDELRCWDRDARNPEPVTVRVPGAGQIALGARQSCALFGRAVRCSPSTTLSGPLEELQLDAPARATRDDEPALFGQLVAAADECTTAAPTMPVGPVLRSAPASANNCGNDRRDPIGPSACAPCPPGQTCPCATPTELCDGRDVPATCAELGWAGGRLACGPTCDAWETSRCTTCPPGAACRALALARGQSPADALALAGRGRELGVAWISAGCANVYFARVRADLSLAAPPALVTVAAGTGGNARLALAATSRGWIVAVARASDVAVYAIAADATITPGFALARAAAPALTPGAAGGPALLVVERRTPSGAQQTVEAFAALVREDGTIEEDARRFIVSREAPNGVTGSVAAQVGDGFVVVRAARIPASGVGGAVVARVGPDGAIVERHALFTPAMQLGSLRATGSGAELLLVAGDAQRVTLSATGAPTGSLTPLGLRDTFSVRATGPDGAVFVRSTRAASSSGGLVSLATPAGAPRRAFLDPTATTVAVTTLGDSPVVGWLHPGTGATRGVALWLSKPPR